VYDLNDTISKHRDNWFNHLTCMDDSRFPRYMLSYKPTGKRLVGRTRKRRMSLIWGAAKDESPQCMKKKKKKWWWWYKTAVGLQLVPQRDMLHNHNS